MAAESAVLVAIGTSMASALLKPVVKKCGDALSKTDSVAGLKSAPLGNLEPKLVHLERELRKLVALISSAESLNPAQDNINDLLILWLKRVEKATHFADNLLDDISYDQFRRQAESNMVSNLFSASDGTSFAFRKKISCKLSKFEPMVAKVYKKVSQRWRGFRSTSRGGNGAGYG